MLEISDASEINKRSDLLKVFIAEILQLPWAIVTDGSTLNDFASLHPAKTVAVRIYNHYGYALHDDDWGLPLWQLLDRCQAPGPRAYA
jgi:hypothetical protein